MTDHKSETNYENLYKSAYVPNIMHARNDFIYRYGRTFIQALNTYIRNNGFVIIDEDSLL